MPLFRRFVRARQAEVRLKPFDHGALPPLRCLAPQLAGASLERGVTPVRRDIEERPQHEGAFMGAWMRQNERPYPGLIIGGPPPAPEPDLSAVIENIDIAAPRVGRPGGRSGARLP